MNVLETIYNKSNLGIVWLGFQMGENGGSIWVSSCKLGGLHV